MHANPVPERQLDCLQRLLGELCARGAIASLVALPFAGTLNVGGADSPSGGPPGGGRHAAILSLADEAAKFLRRRADNAELGARPQPYQVRPLIALCLSQKTFPSVQGLVEHKRAIWVPPHCIYVRETAKVGCKETSDTCLCRAS